MRERAKDECLQGRPLSLCSPPTKKTLSLLCLLLRSHSHVLPVTALYASEARERKRRMSSRSFLSLCSPPTKRHSPCRPWHRCGVACPISPHTHPTLATTALSASERGKGERARARRETPRQHLTTLSRFLVIHLLNSIASISSSGKHSRRRQWAGCTSRQTPDTCRRCAPQTARCCSALKRPLRSCASSTSPSLPPPR